MKCDHFLLPYTGKTSGIFIGLQNKLKQTFKQRNTNYYYWLELTAI